MAGRGFEVVDLQLAEKLQLDFGGRCADFLDVEGAASGASQLVRPFRPQIRLSNSS